MGAFASTILVIKLAYYEKFIKVHANGVLLFSIELKYPVGPSNSNPKRFIDQKTTRFQMITIMKTKINIL